MRRHAFGFVALILATLAAADAAAAGPPLIAVITGSSTQPSWQNVLRGALNAAQDNGVTISFSSLANGTPDEQVALVTEALARKPQALCIDAVDSRAIEPLVRRARQAGIPVVGFGAGVDSPLVASTASTDNRPAAALAARKLASLLGTAARVGLVLSGPGSPDAADRREGFIDELRKRHPDLQVVGPQYSGGDAAAAAEAVKAMLQATPGIEGFFAGDAASAAGTLAAVQELGLAGRTVVVGFDSGQAQIDAIRSGLEAGAVTQDPVRIGYKAVETAVNLLLGRRVPRRVDTGFHWYDRSNLDDPAIAILLHP